MVEVVGAESAVEVVEVEMVEVVVNVVDVQKPLHIVVVDVV